MNVTFHDKDTKILSKKAVYFYRNRIKPHLFAF